MTRLVYCIIILTTTFLGCNNKMPNSVLNKSEWKSVSGILFFANNSNYHLYYKYINSETNDIVNKLYYNCTYLGYEVNDSLVNYILNRKNKIIIPKIDKIFGIDYIYDTTVSNSILYFSEPFYVNKHIICFSVTNKNYGEIKWQFVYFIKKQNNSFKIILYYDTKEDKFYKPINQ
ncbi:MAG: hypothetical protein GXO86_03860 [Chlorobi bacterium]|nr:hypothetical protein [Chlorobiota bacterium]